MPDASYTRRAAKVETVILNVGTAQLARRWRCHLGITCAHIEFHRRPVCRQKDFTVATVGNSGAGQASAGFWLRQISLSCNRQGKGEWLITDEPCQALKSPGLAIDQRCAIRYGRRRFSGEFGNKTTMAIIHTVYQ